MKQNDLQLYCFKYAQSFLPESWIFSGGKQDINVPIAFSVYLICTQNKKILVDAGCVTMPGFEMKDFKSPVTVLKENGIEAKDITDVIITHAHHDHIEAVKFFDGATIHISSEEYENAKAYIPENFRVSTFEEEFCFSPQIRALKWGGHSKGSSIVEIKAADKIHILAGDECYTNANIEQRICTGKFYNKEKAIEFAQKYSDAKYRVHTCHDITIKTERII